MLAPTTAPPSTIPAELGEIEDIIQRGAPGLHAREQCRVPCEHGGYTRELPIWFMSLGSTAPDAPAIGFFGGVHGLERIGAQVVIAWLRSLLARLEWDQTLHELLRSTRMVFMPLVNPGGLLRGTRANPAGVDLMRNAPVQAREPVPWLVGGQRRSAGLPWYRGAAGEPMQPESQALCAVVERELLGRPFSLTVDCHSGFGLHDRVWFPHACTREAFAHIAQVHALVDVFERTHSQHAYVFEPQSRQYLAHGDLWDHLSLPRPGAAGVFIPLTLEMGSWLWVKKNPRQLLSRHGIFNPLAGHRHQRVLRRHLGLLDFLTRATASARHWLPADAPAREQHHAAAVRRWHGPGT